MFRARKMVFIPLACAGLAAAVNGVVAPGFGLGLWGLPELGVEGMALATFCSITAAGLLGLGMAVAKGILCRQSFTPWRWEKRAFSYLVKVSGPAGGMQVFWQTGYLVLFAVTASLPHDSINALAGMTAGMRVESIIFLPAIAFNMTASMLVGHCLGAGDAAEAKRVAWRIVKTGCIVMSIGSLCLWPFVGHIANFVSPDPAPQGHVMDYLKYNLLGTPFSVISMIMGGIFTGAGAALYTMAVFSSAIWLVRLPLAWVLGHFIVGEAWGVFLAMFVSQMVQCTVILYIFHRKDWTRFAMTAKRMKTVAQKSS
jgi:MATE family multidrug resistance protein